MCLQVSGREVFEFRPELVDDDDDEADDTRYASDDEESNTTEVNMKRSTVLNVCLPDPPTVISFGFVLICALWSLK